MRNPGRAGCVVHLGENYRRELDEKMFALNYEVSSNHSTAEYSD